MIPNLKTLGPVLVAVLAMSAFVASAAQAAPVVTTSAGNVSVHGTGESIGEKFTIDGVNIECTTSHFTGVLTPDFQTFELTPVYTGCALGTMVAHIRHEGCKYHYQLTERAAADDYRAHLKLSCGANTVRVEGTGTSCEVQIGEANNTNLTTVNMTDDTAGVVTMKPNISGITANVTKDGVLCPFKGTGPKTGGTYTSIGYVMLTATSGTIAISGE